ncbi:sigma-70 family RNA polymerase sigma factor [Streptomyces sp. NPDC048560]|uniref:RNA polymerase sigma factor n=1 Tax=Streptomyces sp. NPDC048560 TaxID=3155488 RepID=UPI003427D88C
MPLDASALSGGAAPVRHGAGPCRDLVRGALDAWLVRLGYARARRQEVHVKLLPLRGERRGDVEPAHQGDRRADVSAGWCPPSYPEEAFDALYARAAHGLVQQAFLLTGHRTLAFESVEHAFRHAWEHWPELSHDPEPLTTVRAQAHEYALSPWHRFRRASKRPVVPPSDVLHRALLALPPLHRRTLLLCDGLGLSVQHAAEETAASEPAVRNRLFRARTYLEEQVRACEDGADLQHGLRALVREVSASTIPLVGSVRTGSDDRLRMVTRVVFGVMVAFIGLVVWTASSSSADQERFGPGGRAVDRTGAHEGR